MRLLQLSVIVTVCRPISSTEMCFSTFKKCVGFTPALKESPHIKARTPEYPSSTQKRFEVPDNYVSWSTSYKDYKPVDYTAPSVLQKPVWADPDINDASKEFKFNKVDGNVNRKSFLGKYEIVDNKPRNPEGRTGMIGRGLLGKWGPNHAADPIVTRWKRDEGNKIVMKNQKPMLEFIAIQRKDTREWAIPGGMVDNEEKVPLTLKREFGEETLNSLQATEDEKKVWEKEIAALFKKGTLIYEGYVDDPRNTDNAWMETSALNFHDKTGESVGRLPLHAGDDAGAVQWMDVDSSITLYASHNDIIKQTAELHKAYW